MMTGTLPDFPEGIEKIVRDVRKEIKNDKRFGPGQDHEESGALEILNRIRTRELPSDEVGFKRDEWHPINAMANLSVCDWAAKQYFKILLTDLRRYPEFFLDHQRCEPRDC